jgi:DNA polymerase kappa
MLAKICTDFNKPDGQYCLENDREKIIEFMRTLPIKKVPGIGPVSEAVLKAIGIETCGNLFEKNAILRLIFSKHYSEWLLRVSLGISGGDIDHGATVDEGSFKIYWFTENFNGNKFLRWSS